MRTTIFGIILLLTTSVLAQNHKTYVDYERKFAIAQRWSTALNKQDKKEARRVWVKLHGRVKDFPVAYQHAVRMYNLTGPESYEDLIQEISPRNRNEAKLGKSK